MDTASATPLVTIAVPSFNQGRFLHEALASIFQQQVPVEVFVLDALREADTATLAIHVGMLES